MSKTCPDCGKDGLKNLGMHISQSKCQYPNLSENQKEVLSGILMGDGHVRESGIFEVAVKEKEYLDNVVNIFPDWLITKSGVHSFYNESADGEIMWRFRTVSCEETENMRDNWYENGNKNYPIENIELSATVLKHWYATDGGLDGYNRPCLYSSNEDTEVLRDWIANHGYDVCNDKYSVRFNESGAEKLLSDIGKIPGYEYKRASVDWQTGEPEQPESENNDDRDVDNFSL
jgi:hypothetical protein